MLSVLGAPEHALDVPTTTPALKPGEAVRAVQDDVGEHRTVVRRSGPSGAEQTTTYGQDTQASLVTFSGRLAWRVRYRAGADAVYDATVDASTGDVLRVANMVKSEASALVWERFPGNVAGRHRRQRRPRGARLAPGRRDDAQRAERARLQRPRRQQHGGAERGSDAGRRARSRSRSSPSPAAAAMPRDLCSWSGTTRPDRQPRAGHDAGLLLRQPLPRPPGLGADRLQQRRRRVPGQRRGAAQHDGRRLDRPGQRSRQQREHVHAAGRLAAADADVPVARAVPQHVQRQRRGDPLPRVHARALEPARDRRRRRRRAELGPGGGDGGGLERLVRPGLHRRPVPGARHRRLGRGQHGRVHGLHGSKLRTEPIDCPVVAARPGPAARGAPSLGSGGYTYGDFGRISGSAEVHADGEIWAQTLWDLRTALGSEKAACADHDRDGAAAG